MLITCPPQNTVAFASGLQKSLFLSVRRLNDLSLTSQEVIRFYLGPTVTSNGTAAPIYNLRPASPNTSVALTYTSPTITTNGNYIGAICATDYSFESSSLMVILDPGQSMLVTMQSATATKPIGILLSWWEL